MENIPSQPLSLTGKLGQWTITVALVVFLWISGICRLAQLEAKYHDTPLFEDLGTTWYTTGLLTILIISGYFIIAFGVWVHRYRRWQNHIERVRKLERQNRALRTLCRAHGIGIS